MICWLDIEKPSDKWRRVKKKKKKIMKERQQIKEKKGMETKDWNREMSLLVGYNETPRLIGKYMMENSKNCGEIEQKKYRMC